MIRKLMMTVVCFCLPLPALAQALADRVPADALVYVGWQGADALSGPYGQSRLKALMANSQLPRYFAESLPLLAQRIGREDREAGEVVNLILAIGKPLWEHPCAFYFGGVDFSNPRNPAPRLAFIVDGGNQAPQVLQTIKDSLAKTPAPLLAQLHGGRYIVISVAMFPSPEEMLKLIANPAGTRSLAMNENFIRTITKTRRNAALTVYVDGEGIVDTINEGFAAENSPREQQEWARIRDSLGLTGLKRLAFTTGFDKADWATDLYIEAPAPRRGICQLLEGKPLNPELLKRIPRSSLWAVAGQLDLGELLNMVRTIGSRFDPDVPQMIDQGLGEIQKATGVHLQTDLLDPMGPGWAMYTASDVGGQSFMGITILNLLDDPTKVKSSLGRLENFAGQMLAQEMRDVKIGFRTINESGSEIHYLAVPFVAPAWTVRDGFLCIGLYPQTVAAAANGIGAGAPSILDNAAYTGILQRLGANQPSSIAFFDLPRTAPNAYATNLMLMRTLAGFSDLFGVPAPEPMLPSLDKVMAQVTPAGGASWSDASGFYSRSIAPFPMAEMLATDSNIMVAQYAMALGVMLPAVSSARERADRVKCASNLRMIGQGCILYANDNKRYPAKLGDLVETDLPPNAFICPDSGPMPLLPPDVQGDRKKLAEWINENSSYIYLGGTKAEAKVTPNASPELILAYEKFGNHRGDGINVLFNDGHVEWVMLPVAQQIIEAQTKAKP